MKKILIDTMHILELFTTKDSSYVKLSQALDDEKISGVISVTSLAELLIFLGNDIYTKKVNELLPLNLKTASKMDR